MAVKRLICNRIKDSSFSVEPTPPHQGQQRRWCHLINIDEKISNVQQKI